jgi:hypothetical protein
VTTATPGEGDARVAVGGVAGGLFVAGVDDADTVVQAAFVDVLHVAAGEREDVAHAFLLNHASDDFAAVDHVAHG